MYKLKPILVNSALLLLTTVISLFMLELVYRVYLFGDSAFSVEKMNSLHHLGVSGFVKAAEHPELVYELKPHIDGYFQVVEFKTNAQGLRDKEYEIEKAPHEFRVAVIGDSYTLPTGVKIENAFHSILETRLNSEQDSVAYQFINFGTSGYGLRMYVGVMEQKAITYAPDLILIGFCPANDHQPPPAEIFENTYTERPREKTFFQSFALGEGTRIFERMKHRYARKIKRKVATLSGSTTPDKSTVEMPEADDASVFTGEEKAYMADMFAQMNQFSLKHDVPVVVVHLSYRHRPRYIEELEHLVASSGLRYLDVSKPFIGVEEKKYWILPIDAHPNAEAQVLFAEEMYTYLKDEGLFQVPAGSE